MKDRDQAKDEMSERLGQRFGDEEADKSDESDKSDKPDNGDKNVKQDKQTMKAKSDKSAKDYKDVWGSKLIHLPDGLMEPVDNEFDRMKYECDWDVKKERHYYPVVVARGVEAVQEMSGSEFTDAVESLGLR
ncbi:hypothetical protein BDK61_4272 [Haloarcula quadrata]|jgi:hypothetical protein|uniref:DUF8160 domain-containing protein n=3 Tax=Haloarcula TaxID=2237 RepID=A0A8T8KFN0_9EURY|nr:MULTISPECIES: hypothetical protein [Haloarcula]QUJ73978.1 hypothetical protein KDQ40_18580 [Haloarcula sinaiiensis ATCC 33800]QUJ74782.1 hypothetical protein KDQ40_21920 [Haloarcula sinaiiensis ATCC 33800]RKS75757.1 hypothetical protein BDK61_4272 [Haloarcula quadrata]